MRILATFAAPSAQTRITAALPRVLVALITLAACGAPPRADEVAPPASLAVVSPPAGDPAIAELRASGVATPLVARGELRARRIEAPHGSEITLLAATPAGDAVVSADPFGGVRLWPALDGSVEPRVVELPAPRALAIGAAPRGFTIASLDAVGALVIQVVDRDGLTLERVTVRAEPVAYEGLAGVTSQGVVAWRADQRIVRHASDGGITGALAAEAGERVTAIAIAGARAVAVLASERGMRARWLELGDRLAWGAWIATPLPPSPLIALSPSGAVLATLTPTAARGLAVVASDTASGALLVHEQAPGARAIAVPDEDHVAFATAGGILWRRRAQPGALVPAAPAAPGAPLVDTTRPILAPLANGFAVAAASDALTIAEPDRQPEFLGYAHASVGRVAAAGRDGQLLVKLGAAFELLDAQLAPAPRARLQLPEGTTLVSARHLGGDEWLVHATRDADGAGVVVLANVARGATRVIRARAPDLHLGYAPATGLVSLVEAGQLELLRHVPGALRLDRVTRVARPRRAPPLAVFPVDPARARGAELVTIRGTDELVVRWVRDLANLDRGPTLTRDVRLEGVTPAGDVIAWELGADAQLALAVYRDGARRATLDVARPTTVRPDPRGAELAQLAPHGVSVSALDGATRWALPLIGAFDAVWLDDGALAVISHSGIVRIDAATGTVTAARCGWRFARTTMRPRGGRQLESVCAQLR